MDGTTIKLKQTALDLLDAAPDAMVIVDRLGQIVHVNAQVESLLRWSPGDLLGKCIDLLLPDRCRQAHVGQRDRYCESPYVRPMGAGLELCALTKDGRELPVEIGLSPLRTDNGLLVISSIRDISSRKAGERELREAYDEIKQLTNRLEAENLYLREEVRLEHAHHKIVGESPAIKAALGQVEQVGPTASTVLIIGETGTGKELLAHAIHALSKRKQRALVHVNCAALPAALVEGELFGREKGAYTGALSKHIGRFEVADKSTIFLDEVGELPLESQAKLLRVLQEGQFERLGSSRTTTVDVRVIAATNRDLEIEVRERRFREDLYYRLNVFPISVPPLRERLEDVPQLAWAFVDEFADAMGKSIEGISQTSLDALQQYPWPGNVRELRNVIERAMIVCTTPTLRIAVPAQPDSPSRADMTLDSVERTHIEEVLRITGGRVRGANGAAQILGLRPTTLDGKIAKLGIRKPGRGSDIS
ncbi:MAG: sigma-54 interaction domain-containing protein [Planctomycetota bacterium]|jgi:PAS domain S-box-containing protein